VDPLYSSAIDRPVKVRFVLAGVTTCNGRSNAVSHGGGATGCRSSHLYGCRESGWIDGGATQ
jgi:hypothetical protein